MPQELEQLQFTFLQITHIATFNPSDQKVFHNYVVYLILCNPLFGSYF